MEISRNIAGRFQRDLKYLFRGQRLIFFGFLILIGVGLITRLALISLVEHPGHGDYAFYYTVAENIVDGRGLQIDYIWNYLSNPETITHSSNDFWMPLTSILISFSLLVFGKFLSAALIPSIIAGLVLSIVVYFLAKELTDSKFVAFCSASLAMFMPHLFSRSLLTDSPIYYALFVTSSLFFMIKGWENSKFFFISALFAGLAHLTRQDGILLFLTLEIVIVVSPFRWKTKIAYALIALGIYILILTPLLISNYRTFGFPFPPGPSKSMFITQYEDQYAYSKELNLENYLNWGIHNIIQSKISGAIGNVKIIYNTFLGTFLRVFVVVGILTLVASPDRGKKFVKYLSPLLFFSLLFTFYFLVVPVSSGTAGFTRSSMSLIPIFVIIAIDAINRIIPNKTVVIVIILLIAFSSLSKSTQLTRAALDENARIGEELEKLNQVIIREVPEGEQEEMVIMARNPWEVYHTTRHRTIQIPNEDLDTIYEVALKFGANYILLPAPRIALEDIYSGEEIDERYVFKAEVPDSDLRLFEIKLDR